MEKIIAIAIMALSSITTKGQDDSLIYSVKSTWYTAHTVGKEGQNTHDGKTYTTYDDAPYVEFKWHEDGSDNPDNAAVAIVGDTIEAIKNVYRAYLRGRAENERWRRNYSQAIADFNDCANRHNALLDEISVLKIKVAGYKACCNVMTEYTEPNKPTNVKPSNVVKGTWNGSNYPLQSKSH